jgi:two-component system sensor histidine kinase CiaH
MKQMFESATLKLTAWFLLILMSLSLLFSIIIYQISTNELRDRLGGYTSQIESNHTPIKLEPAIRIHEIDKANINLLVALFYANVVILGVGGVLSYLTARRMLLPIEVAHEAQSRFTSDASHELRTPLAVMKSELEVALRDPSLTKNDMQELLESNLEEVNRLSSLSETLLQLSRHDYAALEMKRVNFAEIIRSVLKAHKLPKDRVLQTISAKKIYVQGNQNSLTELIIILLDNALRYSPDDSTISIDVAEHKDTVTFTISNTGEGISPRDLPHVFERFYRADASRSGGKGFGLGLSLAKKIADLHDASLNITSEPGKTTGVTVIFKKA